MKLPWKEIAGLAKDRATYAASVAKAFADEAGDTDNANRWLIHASLMTFVMRACSAIGAVSIEDVSDGN